MELKMRNGVLIVSGEGKVIEVDIVDGELVVYGDDVTIEELEDEDGEEAIEFEDEPDKPTNAFAHLEDRTEPYPLIEGLKVGDNVRLRKDLDVNFDDIRAIGLSRYDEMLEDLSGEDIEIRAIDFEYDEIEDDYFDCLEVEGSEDVWFLSTRWVTKVE